MNTLQRIKQYIDYKGINNKNFEKKIGYSNGAFASQLKNKRSIGSDKIENILKIFPEINPTWLLTGKGSMLLENNENIASEPAVAYKTAPVQEKESLKVEALQHEIQSLKERIKDKEKIIALQEDKIGKDSLQIENLRQKVRQLKELLEKKNIDRKPMGVSASLPAKSPANQSGIIPSEKLQEDKRKRLRK